MNRMDVTFKAGGGVSLAGWLYIPESSTQPSPCVVMGHGFSALKEMGLDDYAQVFARSGLAVLAYDHRNFGASEGEPRFEIDPWQQMHDMRHAISFAQARPEVDPARIGVWGASYAGGHALAVAGVDRRVKCVVAQVPLVSGYLTITRGVPASQMSDYLKKFEAERDSQARGNPPAIMPVTTAGETMEWISEAAKGTVWENKVTVLSQDYFMEYEPRIFVPRISPTPLLMIVGDRDTRCLTDEQLKVFNEASDPKKVVILKDCGHYDPYTKLLGPASEAARDWFVTHLLAM